MAGKGRRGYVIQHKMIVLYRIQASSFHIHLSKGTDGVTEIKDSVISWIPPSLTYFFHR